MQFVTRWWPTLPDMFIVPDSANELPDRGTDLCREVGDASIGLLEDIMNKSSGDHLVRRAGAVQQPAHL